MPAGKNINSSMSKSRNKKSNQPNISPENYIKTRARSLPIGKCFISKNWKVAGNSTVIVSRNHSNGNFTYGLFLVDLFCLGLKDSLYYFNEYSKFNELIDNMRQNQEMVEIEYPLAHNIIYGGVEYADSIGFKPHKSFEVSQYLLEEDDDRVELIDIEFGYNGKPAIFVGKEKHPHNIIATLERTIGKGNFLVMTEQGYDEDIEDDEYEDYDDDDDDDEPLSEEDIAAILDGKKKTSTRIMISISFALYEEVCTEKELVEMNKIIEEVDGWEIVDEEEIDDPLFLNQENELSYQLLYGKVEHDPRKAIAEIESAIAANPDEYHFNSLLSFAYEALHDTKKESENIVSAYSKFPHKILAFTNYIIIQSDKENSVALKKLIGDEFDFQKNFPKRNNLSFEELLSLTGALFLYFSRESGALHKGIAYVMPLCEFIFYNENKLKAEQILLLASKLMLEEISKRKGFDDDDGQEIDEV